MITCHCSLQETDSAICYVEMTLSIIHLHFEVIFGKYIEIKTCEKRRFKDN